MSQLRLAYVNLKVVSRSSRFTNRSCSACAQRSQTYLPPLATKALKLQKEKPRAAAVIESLIDDALARLA